MNECREAFEKYAKSKGIFIWTYSDDESYQGIEAPIAWAAWQAAWNYKEKSDEA